MEYKRKSEEKRETSYVGPGTAGIAQRLPELDKEDSESSRLYVLVKNEVMPCGQNQY